MIADNWGATIESDPQPKTDILRISRLVAKPNYDRVLYAKIKKIMEESPREFFLGRSLDEHGSVVFALLTLWNREEIDQPFGYDEYKDLVQDFSIEYYERT